MQQSNFYSTYRRMSAINVNFYLNNYEKKDGTHQVLLTLTSESKRKRLALDLFVKKSDWNAKKQRVKPKVKNARDYNLIISQAESKITDIKVFYRLNEAHLTLEKLIDEFLLSSPSFDFISFMIFHIKKAPIKESTRKGQLMRL